MIGFLGKMFSSKIQMPDPNKSNKRKQVYKDFVKKGERKLKDLIFTMQDGEEEKRKMAVLAMGKIGGKKVVDPLVKALGDPSVDVQENAMHELIKSEYSCIQLLIDLLNKKDHNNPEAQANAARTLGWIEDKIAVEPLQKALRHQNEWVRWNATFALGKIGEKSSVEHIKKARNQEVYPWVKEYMLNTLVKLERK